MSLMTPFRIRTRYWSRKVLKLVGNKMEDKKTIRQWRGTGQRWRQHWHRRRFLLGWDRERWTTRDRPDPFVWESPQFLTFKLFSLFRDSLFDFSFYVPKSGLRKLSMKSIWSLRKEDLRCPTQCLSFWHVMTTDPHYLCVRQGSWDQKTEVHLLRY